jgi:hypothetical protein
MIQRYKRLFFVLIELVLITSSFLPALAQAQVEFDYNYILSDNDMFDYKSMSFEQIQNFFIAKESTLATYRDPITSLRATEVIYYTAQDFQISPKFLIALLQKEQSLIENKNPSQYNYDWATGYAVCDGCDINDPYIQRYKGFYNQVYGAAKKIRQGYLPSLENNGRTISGLGPNNPKTIDGVLINPANNATAIVYTYTPHLHGNQLLWKIWNKYFTRAYPDGTLLNVDGSKEVWLIENGQRRKFANRSVFLSRYDSFNNVITVNKTELLKYPEGAPIKFANYSFIRTPKGTVYLLIGDTIRGFDSREALRRIGVNPEEIIKIKQEDILDFVEGQPITTKSVYPLGTLLQVKETGGIYWVQDGIKHPIMSREILKSNFANRRTTKMTTKLLTQYETGDPVLFKDGDLVRNKADLGTIYLISNKQRRPFTSEKAFTQLGFDAANIITTNEQSLTIHELGQIINESF